jgi:hypothetical protein
MMLIPLDLLLIINNMLYLERRFDTCHEINVKIQRWALVLFYSCGTTGFIIILSVYGLGPQACSHFELTSDTKNHR